MNLISSLPYITILLANGLYLYMYYFEHELDWFQVFLFNFLLMVFAGIFLMITLNYYLHKWIIEDKQTGDGKTTRKTKIKKFFRQLRNKKVFLENLFLPGNQIFLLKIYLGTAVVRWLYSFVPGILMFLLTALYYEYKDIIRRVFGKPISFAQQQLPKLLTKTIQFVLKQMPRHKSTRNLIDSSTKNVTATE